MGPEGGGSGEPESGSTSHPVLAELGMIIFPLGILDGRCKE